MKYNEVSREVLGLRIKNLRIDLGMTQEELAKKAGYTHKSMIAAIEGGKTGIGMQKFSKIAEILGTTPQYLMGGTHREATDFLVTDTNVGNTVEIAPARTEHINPEVWEYALRIAELPIEEQHKIFSFIDFLSKE